MWMWILPIVMETLQKIGFHTLSSSNSTNPSTISDKCSMSHARVLAQNSKYLREIDKLVYWIMKNLMEMGEKTDNC